MKFEEIKKEEYSIFAYHHPLRNFLQSTQMEEISNSHSQASYYVGIRMNNELIGATRLISIKDKIGKNYFYTPRGPLLDYNNKEVLSFFTDNIKKFVKKHNGYVLHIDPLVIYREHDIDGNVISDGINNEKIVNDLKSLGYIHDGFNNTFDLSKQGRWVVCLNLEGKDEKTILSNMKQNHRNIIHKTERFGIEIEEIPYERLNEYKEITKNTSERKDFNDKSLEYYQTMYKAFKKNVKFLIAYINVDKYISNIRNDLEIERTKFSKIKEANTGKRKEAEIAINSLEKRLNEAKELLKKGNRIALSAAMFVLYGDEIVYLFSGSYKEYMNFYAQYSIQWYIIKYGLKNNFRRYNFYGITGNFDKKDKDYGVYEFKKGFNGYVEEYIGDFDLPVTSLYTFKKLLSKIRKK